MHTEDRKAIDRRLARIEGQVRGVRRLLDEDAYCLDILNQVAAISSALSQVSAAVASQHIKHCVVGHEASDGHPTANAMCRDDLLDELDEVLSRLAR